MNPIFLRRLLVTAGLMFGIQACSPELDGADSADTAQTSTAIAENEVSAAVAETQAEPVPLLELASELAEQATSLDAAPVPSIVCNPRWTTLYSVANDRYVSAEVGWGGLRYGILRARALRADLWERYQLCSISGTYVLKSLANGRYVSAEFGWSGDSLGTLRARATEVGDWERFYIIRLDGGRFALRSYARNFYVSAELGWGGDRYGTLRARATRIERWEIFR
jgi:hypothetical protein